MTSPATVDRVPSTRALARRTSTPVRVPRPQSLPVSTGLGEGVGATELGRIDISPSVVAKLASRAAAEVDDVGAAAPRLLGRDVSGAGLDRLGVRTDEIGALPGATAQVDGRLAFVALTMSVRYPVPVRQVAASVREHVASRVGELTGLEVLEVDITVPALVTQHPRPPRVR